MEMWETGALGMDLSCPKAENHADKKLFSVKYDIFDIDMGWYNRTYYGGL